MAAGSTVRRDLHAVEICTERHALYVVGYLRRPGPPGMDCQQPLRVLCKRCDHTDVWSCGNHRADLCGPCAARYRRRVKAVAESGLRRSSGYLYLLTLTAPGDRAHCKKPGCPGHGDGLGCKHERCSCTPVGGVELAAWNASHSKRWNHFRTVLRREYPDLQFMRGIEVQDGKRGGTARGALHDHALVWSPAPLEKAFCRRLAIAAGFGHSIDLADVQPGSKKAAYYVSKYVSKATSSRADVPWLRQMVDRATGVVEDVVGPGSYRTWSSSREWGDTMTTVRARIAAEVAVRVEAREQAAVTDALALVAETLGAAPIPEESPPP